MKNMLAAVFVMLLCQVPGLCADTVKTKGFYKEDGTYIKQRVVDPISMERAAVPFLTSDLKLRKAQISDFYKGQVVTAKVSFPACHSGITLNSNVGKTNVDMFRKIHKYGAVIEKGEKALITKFAIGRDSIDIELNNGGYGDFGDVSFRVLTGVLTLGLTELRDYVGIRNQRGSRLRIQLGHTPSYDFQAGDLDVERFKEILQTESEANQLVRESLGMEKDQLPLLTEDQLKKALERILVRQDFYVLVNADHMKLPKSTRRLLTKAQKATGKKPLKDTDLRTLNKDVLCALYPGAIQKRSDTFTAQNLDFKTIDKYMAVVFEKDAQGGQKNEVQETRVVFPY